MRRTVLGVADGWLLRLAALAFVLLVVIVLIGAALASPDGEPFTHGTPGAHRLPTSDITVGSCSRPPCPSISDFGPPPPSAYPEVATGTGRWGTDGRER